MVAATLAARDYDETTLAAALLHDVVEDSDTTVEELRAEFGDAVADLVAALSDDESIESYRERKDEHRGRVAVVDGDALAIYGADKLTNMTTLHAALAAEGMQVAEEYDVPIGLKLEVWEADAAMLRHEAPELPMLDDARHGDQPSRGGSKSGRPSSLYLSRRFSGSTAQSTKNIVSTSVVVTTVVATVPKRTLVTSMIAQVIAKRQEAEAEDREPVGDEHEPALLLVAEGEPVVGGGGDQQRRRERGQQQRREVDLLLEGADRGEVLLERDREQEGEQHLDPRQRHPQLLQELAEVAVEPLVFGLVSAGGPDRA